MKELVDQRRAGAEAGRLMIQRCEACGSAQAAARPFCARCGGAVAWEDSAGRGRVAAVTVLHRAPTPEYRARAPYAIALVDLDEGVRVMGHAALDLAVGDAVAARFQNIDGQALPLFEAVAVEAGKAGA